MCVVTRENVVPTESLNPRRSRSRRLVFLPGVPPVTPSAWRGILLLQVPCSLARPGWWRKRSLCDRRRPCLLQLCENHVGERAPVRFPAAARLRCPRPGGRKSVCSADVETTLSGGSLGSCVDEERSQLR